MFPYTTYVILLVCFLYQVLHCSGDNCECGLVGSTNRIVGGRPAPAHKFPWLVPIYNNNKLYCGGSIINPRFVVTAGHCVRWIHKIEDIAMETAVHHKKDHEAKNMYYADEVILHPKFFSYKLYDENDIALIRTDREIEYNDKVGPVCLPERDNSYANDFATVAGWGKLGSGQGAPTLLHETVVKVLTTSACAKTQMKPYLSPTIMCAYFDKTDSCQGDSGGPLVYESEPGKMELIGIVSWGFGCASPIPAIYTRVTEYLDWIKKVTRNMSYCPLH